MAVTRVGQTGPRQSYLAFQPKAQGNIIDYLAMAWDAFTALIVCSGDTFKPGVE